MIKFDYNTYVDKFITSSDISLYDNRKEDAKKFFNLNGDMMGWLDINKLSLITNEINETASFIRNNCDVFIVIGIGGSYLGSSAVIEALSPYFYNNTKKPEIYFLGTSLSTDYYHDLIQMIGDKNVIVNVVSKSGTTLETLVTYNLIMDFMKNKYDANELQKRIIMTTDSESGLLREDVNKYNYKSFVMPNNIGGRYSVFSPVGLLSIAVAGIDVNLLLEGAKASFKSFDDIYKYAVIRDIMFNRNKTVEAFVSYELKLNGLMEWLKQLFAESLGKDGKGILPISLINTRDLHSLGQFVQEGNKILFETVINISNSDNNINIEKYNKSLSELNILASTATSVAHQNGDVLNNIITLDKLDTYNIGYLMQYFMISCAVHGYLMGVNPFDQNGVEEYKKVMRSYL